jgi:PTS system nitrogen regulatory IIA component
MQYNHRCSDYVPGSINHMDVADFITADRIALDVRVRDKARLLRELATRVAPSAGGTTADAILTALRSREQLGSTGLGKGFALPHARIEGLTDFIGSFTRLSRPIDYDAIDGAPVDLVFLLLMPEEAGASQVAALAAVSRTFRDADTIARLRGADAATAFRLLSATP